MNISKSALSIAITAALCSFSTLASPSSLSDIEKITVTSSFKNQSLAQVPTSVAVIGEQQINDQSMQHFEELLNSVANLNFSGGTSRPKYLQIRGVGERSEYRGAPNSSVGFIVDDINLSGLGMAASMYDVQQVEVLRGPQGTRFGANALAGLVYIKSNQPSQSPEHGVKATFGNDDLINLAGFSAGGLTDKLSYRISLEQHQQNGYRDNHYLKRDDTNGIDEFSGKLKLRYQASADLVVDFSYLFADNDNGFDAWTLDNNGFNTLTDDPGVDKQKSHGAAVNFSYQGLAFAQLNAITSYTTTKHQHAYDGDWANADYWANKACADDAGFVPCEYSYLWDKQADRDIWSQEFRLLSNESSRIFANSTDWLLGAYFSQLKETNDLDSSYNGWADEVLDSRYSANNYALFGQLDSNLDEAHQLSVGLRVEKRTTDYIDSAGDEFEPSETMWGGHIALSKKLNTQHSAYIRIAQGYKAGGFNMGLPAQLNAYKEFDTETLVNYELGVKSNLLDNALISRLAVFYMDRKDQQVNASQQNPDKPQQFTIYTANATSSNSYGVELELNYQLSDNLTLDTAFGYLKARYDNYAYLDKYGANIDISGRELAHAPNYTFSVGTTYRSDDGLVANLHWTGKDEFYFSDSHSEKSASANLLNGKIAYEFANFSIALWARNITDKKVATRGFFFGNEPDLDWAAKKYVRYGAPRQIGLTLDYQF
ncbi:Outer membrane receptor proteins, mostly Fe transport [Colwellia chukchiensis]|uniref:Outer membrane receptor proteins, mostly Fe transport n=1 Tax=Colwellia chukchiensis TaxID=641665 RepID=A0A1H7MKH9_9GAMM|nr:TonB-dependent receptor [Colwellia chukchiensis]SEL11195.1 Outer membrane receptor proteins, mostly Fe transport [Colwellia chukchiensis]